MQQDCVWLSQWLWKTCCSSLYNWNCSIVDPPWPCESDQCCVLLQVGSLYYHFPLQSHWVAAACWSSLLFAFLSLIYISGAGLRSGLSNWIFTIHQSQWALDKLPLLEENSPGLISQSIPNKLEGKIGFLGRFVGYWWSSRSQREHFNYSALWWLKWMRKIFGIFLTINISKNPTDCMAVGWNVCL